MTPLADSSISVNVFECKSRTMLSAACSCSQRREMFFLALLQVRFLLYLADSGLLSGH
jgi:hypothetical protein